MCGGDGDYERGKSEQARYFWREHDVRELFTPGDFEVKNRAHGVEQHFLKLTKLIRGKENAEYNEKGCILMAL